MDLSEEEEGAKSSHWPLEGQFPPESEVKRMKVTNLGVLKEKKREGRLQNVP